MAADGTIVIDVTLDDGSVVQGLGRIDNQLGETASRGNKSFGKLGDGIKLVGVAVAAAAAAAAAGAIAIGAGALSAALKVQDANNKIKQSLGVSTEEAKALTDTARGIYKNGFGESLEEVSDALIKVKQNMTAVDEVDLGKATTNAIALAKTFDSDVNEVTRAGNNLMKNFGIDSEKAFDLMAKGAQNGLNFSGELFDNLAEYTPLWADMGFSAEEMFGILNRGADQGVYNFDYLNDVMKEFQIRSTDGSKSTVNAVSALGPAAKKVWGEFSKGKATVADLSAVAATELSKIDDKVKQNELGVALFGTKWEDLGGDVVLAMLESGQAISGFEGAMGQIVATQKEAFGQRWDALLRTSVDALVPLGLMLLDLADKVMPKVQKAVEVMSGFFESKMPAIKAVVEDVIENVKGKFEELKTFWDTSGKGIIENVKHNFGMVKSIIEQIMGIIVPLVKEQIDKIVEFWKSDGDQILSAVKTAFNGIKAVIEFVMPAVKFVIEYVWGAIKNVITGALDVITGAVKVFSGLFTGDFSKMWEGVKQIFKGAIDLILGLMSLSFVGGIKAAIVNFGKTAINLFKNNWTSIINGVKSFVTNFGSNISGLVTKIIGFFKNMYTNTANTIMKMSINIVGRISTMATGMLNALKGLPAKFLQFGKDIVNGLIKGITGNVEKAVDAIKGVGSAIKDKFADMLNIHSPSRVFQEYGKFTVEGYQKGINENTGMATGAITNLGKKIVEIGKLNALEEQKLLLESTKKIQEIQKAADDKLANLTVSKMVKKKRVIIDNSKKIAKIEADEAKKIADIQEKLEKDTLAVTADIQKQKLDAIKLYVEDKKTLEELSVHDEIALWATAVNSFEEGTKERVEAQKRYGASIDAVNKDLVSVNERYTKAMTDINNDYINNEKRITEVYANAVEAKEKALFNFMNLFDQFDLKIEKSGVELLNNLKSQVDGFKEWEIEINKISNKAIDQGLVRELTELGPKALAELKALNSLTDTQLTEYSDMYAEKSKLAKDRALVETAALKTDTDSQLDELKKSTTLKLSELEDLWADEIKGVTETTANEFKSLETIGADAVRGLVAGMTSMHKDLENAAKSLADTVTSTTKKTLKIHSPSRVMRYEVGQMIGEGLALGIDDSIGMVEEKSKVVASSAVNSAANVLKKAPTFLEKLGKEVFATAGDIMAKVPEIFETGDKYGADIISFLKEAMSMKHLSDFDLSVIQSEYERQLNLASFRLADMERETTQNLVRIEQERSDKRLAVIDAYESEVTKKTSEILKQYGLIDKVEIKSIEASDLTDSLESQIASMKLYTESIANLSARGLNSDLLNEISSLGTKMAGEVASFANLTDEELNTYVALWEEKSALARSVAESSLIGMREDMNKQLQQIDTDTQNELDSYLNNYNTLYEAVHGVTDTNMNKLKEDMTNDGINAMQGLINGMDTMKSNVISKAAEIANSIKDTIQGALDIHSPSRWMRDFVAGNLAKGFEQGVDKNSGTFMSASSNIADLIKSDLVNPLRGVKLDVGNISGGSGYANSVSNHSVNNARTINAPVTVYGSAGDENSISRELRKLSFMYGA